MKKKEMVKDMGVSLLTAADIDEMKAVDVKNIDRSILNDIQEVKINTELPKKERILDFIRQIGNPYCYRHGKYIVKVSFLNTNVTLEDRILSYLRSQC